MSSPTNDQKIWFTEYNPAVMARYQNVEDVYSGKMMDETIDGEEKTHYIRGQQEMNSLGSEFDKHTYQVVDYEKRKTLAAGAVIANWWSHQELARMVFNPIPGVVNEQ